MENDVRQLVPSRLAGLRVRSAALKLFAVVIPDLLEHVQDSS